MIKIFYSIFRFSFEILCIAIAGYWGFGKTSLGGWRFLLGIAAPLLLMAVWSIWGAPMSPNRLEGLARLLFELSVYTVSAFFIYQTRLQNLTLPFPIVAAANACINYLTGWLI